MSAQGQLEISQEQAHVEREQANQAKIVTKRKTFDEMMYEKANTPTFTEVQSQTDMMIVRRMMSHPEPAEVISGKSQNVLLPYLDKLLRVGVQGPVISLDPTMLKSINVTAGPNAYNIGILKDGGVVDWPFGLRGATQMKLAALLPKLVSSAVSGNVDFDLYTQANKSIAALSDELYKRFQNDAIDGGLYLQGKHFLESLRSAMAALTTPNVAISQWNVCGDRPHGAGAGLQHDLERAEIRPCGAGQRRSLFRLAVRARVLCRRRHQQ